MASYRQIHTKIWKDPWFLDLPPDRKLLFIYLFSNEQANMMGLYQLPLKVIAFETGLDAQAVKEGLDQFAVDGKVYYEDHHIWIVNMFQYNANNPSSPKTQAHVLNTLDAIPDIPLKARLLKHYASIIPYGYPMDTPSIPVPQEQEQEQRTDHEQEQEQQQQHNTPAAVVVLEKVHDLGITDPKAGKLVQIAADGGWLMDLPMALEGWIAHYREKDNVKSPIGLAIKQVEAGSMPPRASLGRRKYIEGEWADIIEH